MRLDALAYFYRRRLRTQLAQEILAGVGIAVGVALAFAVLAANASIAGSAREIVRGVVGTAQLQLAARDARGFDERMLSDVRQIPGVLRAAPLLEQRGVIKAPGGHETAVNVAGVDPALAQLSGRLAGNALGSGLGFVRGIVLPNATAQALQFDDPSGQGILRALPSVRLEVRGRARTVPVSGVLGRDALGPLSDALVAIMPLARLQAMADVRGRVTRILVEARPDRIAEVQRALETLAESRLTVSAADVETRLLAQALGPANQATAFFAGISVLLGLLLAFNAMLLTVPERRRLVAELRLQGFKPRQLVVLLLSQALALGMVASLVGILAGSLLARTVFDETPEYLSPPFTLGTGTTFDLLPLAVAFLGGVVACCLASAPPLLDLRRGRAVDAVLQASGVPGNALTARGRHAMLIAAVGLVAVTVVMFVVVPRTALIASVLLAIATVLLVPTAFAVAVRCGELLAARVPRLSLVSVALLAQRATTVRSLALAATGAVAVFGSVAIAGARDDLLRGIGDYASDFVSTADIWIVNPLDNQATIGTRATDAMSRIERLPEVEDVRRYDGGFLDAFDRRLWLLARPSDDPEMLPPSQLVDGDLDTATTRLRSGGWIAVNDRLAADQDLAVGDVLSVPTPSGVVDMRVAATTTNLGWAPGAMILNGDDYERWWHGGDPTALQVDAVSGADAGALRARIADVLGPDSGLQVLMAGEREVLINASARQGLNRLNQISTLLLCSAVLAMAAALAATIWQRRPALAAMRIQSFTPVQLWRILLMEATVGLGAGCLTGALVGLLGQIGADRFLRYATGFPVTIELTGTDTLRTFAIVVLAALVAVAVPSWLAARVPPRLGLQE